MKRAAFAALLCASCTRSQSTADASPPEPEAATPIVSATPPRFPPTLDGSWVRKTEPYRGMQIEVGMTRERAVVRVAPPVTAERVASDAGSTAQLECQSKLWKPGEDLLTDIRPSDDGTYDATILIRDWGLTAGVCRHADSKAKAHLVLTNDELAITVTRGKSVVTQTWARGTL